MIHGSGTQLQVGESYTVLFNLKPNSCRSSCLNAHFVPNNSGYNRLKTTIVVSVRASSVEQVLKFPPQDMSAKTINVLMVWLPRPTTSRGWKWFLDSNILGASHTRIYISCLIYRIQHFFLPCRSSIWMWCLQIDSECSSNILYYLQSS